MKAIATEASQQSIAAEDAFRLIVDTTPALIHTGRQDSHLGDYVNRQRFLSRRSARNASRTKPSRRYYQPARSDRGYSGGGVVMSK